MKKIRIPDFRYEKVNSLKEKTRTGTILFFIELLKGRLKSSHVHMCIYSLAFFVSRCDTIFNKSSGHKSGNIVHSIDNIK